MLTEAQLTYHLGNDKHWADPRFSDYAEFNFKEAQSVVRRLAATDQTRAKKLSDFIVTHESGRHRALLPF
jgi:hypothetical protein